MFISFIMPAYNAELTISNAVSSLLAQCNPDWELLIIDDGSSDSTGVIANCLAERDERIRVFQQENRGVAAARNQGIGQSRGDFLFFIDADDALSPRFISKLKTRSDGDTYDVIEIPYDWSNDGREFFPEDYTGSTRQYLERRLAAHSGFACWKFVFSRDFIMRSRIRFVEGRRSGEDQEFVLRCFLDADTCTTIADGVPLYHYWVDNPDSARRSHSAAQFDYPRAMKNVFEMYSEKVGDSASSHLRSLLAARVVEATSRAAVLAYAKGVPLKSVLKECKPILTREIETACSKSELGIADGFFLAILRHFSWAIRPYLLTCKSRYRQAI